MDLNVSNQFLNNLTSTNPLQECVNDCHRQILDVTNRFGFALSWMSIISFAVVAFLSITYILKVRSAKRVLAGKPPLPGSLLFDKQVFGMLFALIVSTGWLFERALSAMLGLG